MAINRVEELLQYHFQDPNLLDEAFIAAGLHKEDKTRNDGNKVLALIGDALLRLILVDDGIAAGKTRCQCDRICAREACNNNLQRLQRSLQLGPLIKLPKSCKGIPRTTGASTMEALVGAVWLDSGRDVCKVHHVIHNLNIGRGLLHGVHDYGDV